LLLLCCWENWASGRIKMKLSFFNLFFLYIISCLKRKISWREIKHDERILIHAFHKLLIVIIISCSPHLSSLISSYPQTPTWNQTKLSHSLSFTFSLSWWMKTPGLEGNSSSSRLNLHLDTFFKWQIWLNSVENRNVAVNLVVKI